MTRGPNKTPDQVLAEMENRLARVGARVRAESKSAKRTAKAKAQQEIGRLLLELADEDLRAELGLSAVWDRADMTSFSEGVSAELETLIENAYPADDHMKSESAALTDSDVNALHDAIVLLVEQTQTFFLMSFAIDFNIQHYNMRSYRDLNERMGVAMEVVTRITAKLDERGDKS